MKNHKVIFTGGHHTSAIIIAKTLQKKGIDVYWFGHRYTMRRAKNISAEYKEVTAANIPFYSLISGKFHRAKLTDFIKLPIGFLQSLWLLIKLRPNLIFSFGGYLAVPVVLAGWLLGIPSVTHEQTTTTGRANRLLKHFVKKIFISFESSRKLFPAKKTILTGLPLPDMTRVVPLQLFQNNLPTIFVTGGKQGSHIINKTIESISLQLLERYNLFHQTGETTFTKDLTCLKQKKETLPPKLKKRYQVVGYIKDKLFTNVLKQTDLVISRAGAHTVYKLLFFAKKAILIPLPFSFDDEQKKNAKLLEKCELGLILPQKSLSGEKLLAAINKLHKKKINKKLSQKTKHLIKTNATQKILKEISLFLSYKGPTLRVGPL